MAFGARGKGAGVACARTVGGRAQHAWGPDGGGGGWKWDTPRGGGAQWGGSGPAAAGPDECARSSSLEVAVSASEGLGEGGPRRDPRGTGSHLHSGTSSGAAGARRPHGAAGRGGGEGRGLGGEPSWGRGLAASWEAWGEGEAGVEEGLDWVCEECGGEGPGPDSEIKV